MKVTIRLHVEGMEQYIHKPFYPTALIGKGTLRTVRYFGERMYAQESDALVH
jgi:hypothetical protein